MSMSAAEEVLIVERIEDIFEEEVRELEKIIPHHKNQKNLIVFYGSSTIRLWPGLKQDMDPLNVLNLGFGGSNFPACAHYFDRIFKTLTPTQMVVYAGDNDLGNGHSIMRVFNDYRNLIDKIQTRYPGIQIHVISIKPSPNRAHLLPKTSEVNALMKRHILSQKNGKWIEILGKMITQDAKTIPELYVEDQLHLNEKGYEIVRKVVKHHLFSNNQVI